MLTLLTKLFSRDVYSERSLPNTAAPSANISYKSGLVTELQTDHKELLKLFTALVLAHRSGDFDGAVAHLKRFTYALRAHLLKENLHLYIYLKHALREDQESSDLMSSMRVEMGRIGRALNEFVTRYTSSPWDPAARERLRGELDKIAEILTRRIQQEEEVLYPMYLPPDSYR
jgi:hemerythrin-like domain-containing protein